MNVWKIFDTIEEAVASSQRLPAPFSHWSLMNRHKFMRLMDKMRTSVSPELKLARGISKDVNRLLSEAQDQADEIVREAREKARQERDAMRVERENLLDTSEIVRAASKRAEEMEAAARLAAEDLEAQTRQRCVDVRRQADEYAGEIRRQADEYAREVRRQTDEYVVEMRRQLQQDTRGHETELEAYAVKLLSNMEHEIERALQVVRTHRQTVERRPQPQGAVADDDTAELMDARRVVAAASAVP